MITAFPVISMMLLPLFFLSSLTLSARPMEKVPERPNVLFIIVDDLRPELPCYGNSFIHAPSIDRLAAKGVVFENAFCQYPVCGPSRCSLLSGLRPTRDRFIDNSSQVDIDAPGIIPLPQWFKDQGYYTISNGKVYHDQGNVMDGMDGWSEIPWEPHPGFWVWLDSSASKHNYRGSRYRMQTVKNMGPAWESLEVPDNAYPTGVVTDRSLQDLQRLAGMDQPFFLAVGYRKPHLPMNAPTKYWELYDSSAISLPGNFHTDRNLAAPLYLNSGELRNYGNIPGSGEIPLWQWEKVLHGYYACISYTDAQIGRLMDELDRLGLSDNTLIVLLGDHGYHLAEYRVWGKNNPLSLSLRAPLIFHVPWSEGSGKRAQMVEFIDIYPTLVELCGLPVPNHLDGVSIAEHLGPAGDREGKDSVFARVGDAETVLTTRFSYTEWQDDGGEVYARLLFDREIDPDESKNLASDPAFGPTVDSLSTILNQHLSERR